MEKDSWGSAGHWVVARAERQAWSWEWRRLPGLHTAGLEFAELGAEPLRIAEDGTKVTAW